MSSNLVLGQVLYLARLGGAAISANLFSLFRKKYTGSSIWSFEKDLV